MNTQNLVGVSFGDLKVVGTAKCPRPSGQANGHFWECECKCGTKIVVQAGDLRRGRASSCRPCSMIRAGIKNRTHGASVGGKMTPEYRAWSNMKFRCYNPNWHKHHLWGGRGIRVCNEWLNDFQAFYNHVGPRPSSQHSLDRIDNDKNYEPGNVRWASRVEQRNNQRLGVR